MDGQERADRTLVGQVFNLSGQVGNLSYEREICANSKAFKLAGRPDRCKSGKRPVSPAGSAFDADYHDYIQSGLGPRPERS